jgi:hypothetical protein
MYIIFQSLTCRKREEVLYKGEYFIQNTRGYNFHSSQRAIIHVKSIYAKFVCLTQYNDICKVSSKYLQWLIKPEVSCQTITLLYFDAWLSRTAP